jgi:WD40 repeat protein/serine/threonine protein kinase
MATTDPHREALLVRLGDEFAARYRQGERPPLQEYIERYPELADDIRELFPALVEIEQAKEDRNELAPSLAGPALRQLGDFRILREVGRGGMGVVYEAEQLSLGRHVALKVMPQKLLLDARSKGRFEREARAAAKLHHTNIVPVFGVGEQDGLPFYAMQFIQGHGLDAVIEELRRLQPRECAGAGPPSPIGKAEHPARRDVSAVEVARSLLTGEFHPPPDGTVGEIPAAAPQLPAPDSRLSDPSAPSSSSVVLPGQSTDGQGQRTRRATYWQSVAQVGVQVAQALEYAHKQGVLHRDVKPSNLLLDTAGTVWVTDFGLAKADDQENLTRTGDILGTFRYMPPEAFEGKSDSRSDVYSLGLTLYELLALRPAFDERERNRLIKQVTTTEARPLDRLNRAIPRDLVTVVHKAIEREPGRRYPTAGELAADLQRFLQDEPIRARRLSPWERVRRWGRRNPVVAGLTAAVLVVLLAGVAFSMFFALQARDKAAVAERRAEEVGRERDAGQRLLYAANLNLAQIAWKEGQVSRLRELLDGQRPERTRGLDLRSLEWAYWDRLSQSELNRLEGHASYPNSVACSPDGRLAASYGAVEGADGEVIVWDLVASRKLAAFSRPGRGRGQVCFHREGRWLVVVRSVSPKGFEWTAGHVKALDVMTWDCEAHHERSQRTLPLPDGFVFEDSALSISPDGQRLAAGSRDGQIKVWDWEAGQELLELRGHTREVLTVAFSPDGTLLASGSGSGLLGEPGELKLWDAATGRELLNIPRSPHGVTAVAFSPDGRRLATGTGDRGGIGEANLWDVTSGQELLRISGESEAVNFLVFSPDGQGLATCGWLRPGVRLWDTRTGQNLLSIHGDVRAPVAFSPDGRQLLARGGKKTLAVWDAVQNPAFRSLRVCKTLENGSMALTPDGRLLATDGNDTIRGGKVWDARTGEHLLDIPGRNAVFHPDSRRLAFIDSWDNSVHVWDVPAGQEQLRLQGHTSWVRGLVFSPDGRLLAGAGNGGTVRLWDLATGTEIARCQGHTGNVVKVVFSPDGRRLVSAGQDTTVRVWDVPGGRELLTFREHAAEVAGVSFSPDGLLIASEDRKHNLILWDSATGNVKHALNIGSGPAGDVCFTPDGRRLVALAGMEVKVWDVATGQETISFGDSSSRKYRLLLSADGQLVLAGNMDGTVTIWDARPLTPELRAEREALSLLALLYSRGLTREQVREHVEKDATLCEPVRQQALALTDSYGKGVAYREASRRIEALHRKVSSGEELHTALQNEAGLNADVRALALTLGDSFWKKLIDQKATDHVQELKNKSLLKEEILAALKKEPALSEEIRQRALAKVEQSQDNAESLNGVSWGIVRRTDATAEQYGRALELAVAACRLDPENGLYLNTLGVAQYRTGQYREALATLTRSEQLNARANQGSLSEDLAFLAMTQYHLGQREQARMTLARLREAMALPKGATKEEAQDFLREAEALIAADKAGPKS